jgi:predicted nucleic acid-binding protein
VDRIFLDANVLFSAAFRPEARLSRLWELRGVDLYRCVHAAEEAKLNLAEDAQRSRLEKLLRTAHVLRDVSSGVFPAGVALPQKDRPILAAALRVQATHLLTGDKRHFGRYYGRTIGGVLVLRPGEELTSRVERQRAPRMVIDGQSQGTRSLPPVL